jgi:DNA-binding FrmR family transcriptional regulator
MDTDRTGLGGMELPASTTSDLQRRLRKIEGQVRGVQQMIADGRACSDVVTQIAAANKALEQVGLIFLTAGLTWCVQNPQHSTAAGYDLDEVQRLFLKLA